MKVTGYRTLRTVHDWARVVGDVNGVSGGTRTVSDVLVLETDVGIEGFAVAAHGDIERLFPVIEGSDPRCVTATYDRMLAQVFKSSHQGSVFATIGAIDLALWDLKAKAIGEPLWRLLGGADRFVPGYASGLDFGLDDDELAELYQRFAARGFQAGKIKGGFDPRDDVRRLKLVADILRRRDSRTGLMLDANEAWHRSQAVRHVAEVEQELDLTWIEEPVRRWDAAGHAAVRQLVRAGVATGENLTGLEQTRALLVADAVDIVQFNSGGGITNALRTSTLAHAHDLPVSPVGFTPSIAAALPALPNHLVAEVQDLHFPAGVHFDIEFADGGMVLGEEVGAGIALDPALMIDPDGPGFAGATGPHVRPTRAGLRIGVNLVEAS